MVIDANMYWFPEEIFEDIEELERFLALIPAEHGVYAYAADIGDEGRQIVLERPQGYASLNYVQGNYRLQTQLADMDAAGVDKAILKVPGCHEFFDLGMCRRFNDGMARHAAASGGRLAALAVVPPRGMPACLDEVDRCLGELGMKGVQLTAHYGGLYLDNDLFDPLFRRLNELAATVYVHHTPVPVQYDSLCTYNNLRRSYGRCVDQMTAIGRELFSGFFEKYPRLKMVHSMLGGGFFAYACLLQPQQPAQAEQVMRFADADAGIARALRENLFFEMSHAQPWGKAQLECAVQVLGADHVLFGSSYPVRDQWLSGGPAFVQGLAIPETAKAMLLGENARRLYNL